MIEKFRDVKDYRWLKRYLRFIETFKKDSIYKNQTHNHHILPSANYEEYSNLKENPWNLAILDYKAHYLAHYMLAKAVGGNMWYAWNMMNNSKENYSLNSKLYEVAKREHSKIVSKHMTENNPARRPEVIAKIIKANTGRKASEETKLRMSKAQSIAQLGKKLSDETKNKLSKIGKGNSNASGKRTEESKKNISKGRKGKMMGMLHFKVKTHILFDKFGRVKYVINESLTSFNKKVEEPILKIHKQRSRYKTRFRKYQKYEGSFILNLSRIKYSLSNN